MDKQYPTSKESFDQKFRNEYFSAAKIIETDDLTVTLRGCLLVEYLLEIILKRDFKNDKILKDRSFTFFHKIKLLYSKGIISKEEFTALQKLAEIRNLFAHVIETTFSQLIKEVNDFTISIDNISNNMDDLFQKYANDNKLLFGLAVNYLLGSIAEIAYE